MDGHSVDNQVFKRVDGGPRNITELDISLPLVENILLRFLYSRGTSSLTDIGNALKLSFSLTQVIFQRLRERSMFEVIGMVGHDYQISLSGPGRSYAAKLYDTCHYSGPIPVSIESYTQMVTEQIPDLRLNRQLLRGALSDAVVTDSFLDQLGPALMTQDPIFLYGPSGNGKTFVANQVLNIYQDAILIPYALEFDGQIIVVYDPSVHKKLDDVDYSGDPRWVVCRRPFVVCGGELSTPMLELHADEGSNVYAAPVQLKANNGIMVIDDFGRQMMSPQVLLNRWIVPLERKIDFLTLKYGVKLQVPFEMNIVFATNLDPSHLVDEAFLRRIKNKIYVAPVSTEIFDQIFYKLVEERELLCQSDCAASLRQLCLTMGSKILQACIPKDILDIVASIDQYEGEATPLNADKIQRAANLYFTKIQHFVDQ